MRTSQIAAYIPLPGWKRIAVSVSCVQHSPYVHGFFYRARLEYDVDQSGDQIGWLAAIPLPAIV